MKSDSSSLGSLAAFFAVLTLWQARQRRLPYCNLPDELRPASIAEAYAAQEAYYRLAGPTFGPVAGAKIARRCRDGCGQGPFPGAAQHQKPVHARLARAMVVR